VGGERPPWQDNVDTAIAELARRQHGVVARRQLLALGLSSSAIGERLANGRPHRVHRGVYAAVLAAGPDAVLARRSALEIHGVRSMARAA